ncbi:hypothetical protein PQ455_07685 [Sphingomonas naphthae]|uniref:Uncharacterized protein n=1 Tax=Sphingomonas naphthae TaxID=1813468 RepID=A0ABY7TT83_9SPHN|nr:hypothetical protein [Sphingomonas naphthae]WCT75084.1 hypothetical protein PQ455_07685 [Sphingomonas naphthae]
MNATFRTGALALILASSTAVFAAPQAAPSPTVSEAEAMAKPTPPASPEQSASAPAQARPLLTTGTAADLIGNAGDPAGSTRGAMISAYSNAPAATSVQSPVGPAPASSAPPARPY